MDIYFDPGVILWKFDEEKQIVTVINNSENGYCAFESGNYLYSIENSGGNLSMTIDGITFGSVDIQKNEINLDQTIVDGIFSELNK